MLTGLEGLYRIYARCPKCGEDWSWGYQKPELATFAQDRSSKSLICRKCKRIYSFAVLLNQLVA